MWIVFSPTPFHFARELFTGLHAEFDALRDLAREHAGDGVGGGQVDFAIGKGGRGEGGHGGRGLRSVFIECR